MSATEQAVAAAADAERPTHHESILVYRQFRYLKLAALVSAIAIAIYIADVPYGSRYGGSWAGYTLGTAGALLILWLTWFGYRKRTYTVNTGDLAGRLSAHVYLGGVALIVIATLHTGFHFGWNIHTLAYALMCVVIASGMFGVVIYVRYPRLMTENRHGMTMVEMLGQIATVNEELLRAVVGAQLDDRTAAVVRRAVESTEIGGSVRRQLSGRYPRCATAAALAGTQAAAADFAPEQEEAMRQVRVLLNQKAGLLARVRRDIAYKALMDVWLYVHVPLSFALLAALIAHVVSVFFLW
jgi:hypothetical protein